MKNAKLEILDHLNEIDMSMTDIVCIEFVLLGSNPIHLLTEWTKEECEEFLKLIDFSYDNGYGSQKIGGVIWYKDGTWSSRREYDGSEWWAYYNQPPIPKYLIRIDKIRDRKIKNILS